MRHDGRAACPARADYTYVPALDGLRAVAVLLVIASHLGLGRVVPGGLGVTVFFFISGLLITRQLLAEWREAGRIAIGGFYLRRVLRLFPALLAMVAASGVGFSLLGGRVTGGQVAAALLYYANYAFLAGRFTTGQVTAFHPFSILWSLAVEEHFYLLFPLVVAAFARRPRGLAWGIAVALVAIGLWRWHVAAACDAAPAACLGGNAEDRVVYATDTRADAILFGCWLAVLLDGAAAGRVLRLLRPGGFALGLALLLASLAIRAAFFRDSLRFSLQGVALFLALGALLFCPRLAALRGWLSRRPAVLVGRWSYSLYLWHWAVLTLASAAWPLAVGGPITGQRFDAHWFAVTAPLLLAGSFAAALASYYAIERPMVALRRRFGAHAVADRREAALSPVGR